MSVTITVPDSVVGAIRLPEPEMEERLRMELAVALYAQGVLSLGKAAELAEMDRIPFGQLVGKRGIPRHYGEEDLARDLRYAGYQ